jgi:hypothetical protein
MRSNAWLVLCALCGSVACSFPKDDGDGNRAGPVSVEPGARPALTCAPRGHAWDEVQRLYDTTEQSVHELVTCGGLQVRMASNIVTMLIASNEDLFKDEERGYIEQFTLNPFTHTEDGTWSMAISESPGSTFTLSFYDPRSGEQIVEDVFDLDSYLEGVHIQTEIGFDEMLAHAAEKHSFVFTWEAEGPLAHLVNGGQPLPDSFELQLSINDFLASQPSDFGPMASVFELEVDSVVTFLDERSADSVVEYRVNALRDRLDSIAVGQTLDFDVERLEGRSQQLKLAGNAEDLRFVGVGTLAGRIDYELTGNVDDRKVELRVTSDFGGGAPYPTARWSCP